MILIVHDGLGDKGAAELSAALGPLAMLIRVGVMPVGRRFSSIVITHDALKTINISPADYVWACDHLPGFLDQPQAPR